MTDQEKLDLTQKRIKKALSILSHDPMGGAFPLGAGGSCSNKSKRNSRNKQNSATIERKVAAAVLLPRLQAEERRLRARIANPPVPRQTRTAPVALNPKLVQPCWLTAGSVTLEDAAALAMREIEQFHSMAYPGCEGGCPAHEAIAALVAAGIPSRFYKGG